MTTDRFARLKSKLADLKARRGTPTPARRPTAPVRPPLPCVHEGDVIEPCTSCAGEAGHVRECDKFGRCTRTDRKKGVAICATCAEYQPDPALLPRV